MAHALEWFWEVRGLLCGELDFEGCGICVVGVLVFVGDGVVVV